MAPAMMRKIITVVFIGFAAEPGAEPRAADDAAAAGWFALDELPELAFDHADIIALARARLEAGEV